MIEDQSVAVGADAAPVVRCAVSDRNPHSRIALVPTPLLRLKRCHVCDQWHSSRLSTVLNGRHYTFRPNTEGQRTSCTFFCF
jgi:hypothetical protein